MQLMLIFFFPFADCLLLLKFCRKILMICCYILESICYQIVVLNCHLKGTALVVQENVKLLHRAHYCLHNKIFSINF
jgi:hypothetical protein